MRLALFAEIMKGKPWIPATLKKVGGTEGVGVSFLEETFSAATAAPEHRYHQHAARQVLTALLPELGTDIKGHTRSYTELLRASGYARRPQEFDELIRILDSELRLITPTEVGTEEGDGESPVGGGWRGGGHDDVTEELAGPDGSDQQQVQPPPHSEIKRAPLNKLHPSRYF